MKNRTGKLGAGIPVLLLLLLPACGRQAAVLDPEREKAAIRDVIVKETTAYYKQDYATWKSTYVAKPYFREHGYWDGYPEKVRIYNSFAELDSLKKKQFDDNKTVWQTAEVTRSNENFRIYGDVAWYTSDQVSTDRNTGKLLGKSVDIRILEKEKGEWKIAYLGFYYLPLEKK
ncbi:hypothetical protein [Dyadobacter sp. 676]|uniref:Nuclear transport factor 2 family protein n=1 Tax=Dyadobacter sp. 676 TaxID=3088362 RepID=A0AAU8FHI4_9BACT